MRTARTQDWIRIVVPSHADVAGMITAFQSAGALQDRDYEIWVTAPHPRGGMGEVLRAWRHGDVQGTSEPVALPAEAGEFTLPGLRIAGVIRSAGP